MFHLICDYYYYYYYSFIQNIFPRRFLNNITISALTSYDGNGRIYTRDELSVRGIIRLSINPKTKFCGIICQDICIDILRKYRNQSLSCGNFVKKPSRFRLDINLETDNPSKTNHLASDEFCFIIRLCTEFILETGYQSETDNSSVV